MASVHSLDIVAVNAQPVPRFRREFPAWRHTLKAHWTEIKDLLCQCYDVIDSLVILVHSTGQFSDRECISFLQELMKNVNNIEIGFRASVTKNSDISRKFAIASRRLFSSRRNSVTSVGPPNGLMSSQRPSGEHLVSGRLSARFINHLPNTVALDLSPDLQAFVANQINAAYPDSSSASASASQYLGETEKHLSTILDFWTTLRADWKDMLIIPMSKQRIVGKYDRYVPSWELDREHIRAAIASITRSIEAITIEAARIPQRRSTADGFPSLSPPNLDNIIIPHNRNAPLPPLPLNVAPHPAIPRYLHQTAPATPIPSTAAYAHRSSSESPTAAHMPCSSPVSSITAYAPRSSSVSSASRTKPASGPSTLSKKPRTPAPRSSSEVSYRESKSKAIPTFKEFFTSNHSSNNKKG